PVIAMRRTATRDTTLNEHQIKEGDKLVLYYWSANRDESVFTEPEKFDILRDPNPHVRFGGPGPHFCLGAHLARRQLTVMFRQLLRRMPEIRASAEPARLGSIVLNGLMPVPYPFRYRRRGRAVAPAGPTGRAGVHGPVRWEPPPETRRPGSGTCRGPGLRNGVSAARA